MLTWMYGTGATGTGAHPFSLRVQGVDYIDAVPIESIVVNASVSSNATLTFTIVDPTGTMPVPQGWADVEFVDNGGTSVTPGAFDADSFDTDSFDTAQEAATTDEAEWIFGGLVMGVESTLGPPPIVEHRVRCVDYGILLDVTPVMADITFRAGSPYLYELIQGIAAAAPLGGLMALPYAAGDPGRLYALSDLSVFMSYGAETVTARQAVRSPLEAYAARQRQWDWSGNIPVPANVWVTPLRQLSALPIGSTFDAAPLEVRQDPTTSSHVAASNVSVDEDSRGIESGVWVADSDTTYGGDNSGWHRGTVNGYSVMPSSTSQRMFEDDEPAVYGRQYVSLRTAVTSGEVTVASAKNFQPGQELTVYYPGLDLDGTYAITAVSTRFLGGTSLMRLSTIQFNGERGTVARFNRTRFARAGVTT